MTDSGHILMVEDDVRIATMMQEYLHRQGFSVDLEHNGSAAVRRILDEQPDLVILDVLLPGENGFSICRRVRDEYAKPILFLTGRGEELDQVLGLEMGADDYVAKPVSPRLLLARIRALLRRTSSREDSAERIEDGELIIDRSKREVRLADRMLDLTTAEFDLLWILASHAGQALSRENLFQLLRGIPYDGVDRSIDMRVSQVRRALKRGSQKREWIKTVRGVGYQFVRHSG